MGEIDERTGTRSEGELKPTRGTVICSGSGTMAGPAGSIRTGDREATGMVVDRARPQGGDTARRLCRSCYAAAVKAEQGTAVTLPVTFDLSKMKRVTADLGK